MPVLVGSRPTWEPRLEGDTRGCASYHPDGEGISDAARASMYPYIQHESVWRSSVSGRSGSEMHEEPRSWMVSP